MKKDLLKCLFFFIFFPGQKSWETVMRKEIKLSYVILVTTMVLLGIMLLIVFVILQEPGLTDQLSELMQQRFNNSSEPRYFIVGKDTTHADTLLTHFYEERDFQPAWFSDNGPLWIADSMIKSVHEAEFEGLNPKDYHAPILDSLLDKIQMDVKLKLPVNISQLMNLEILLTDAFLLYANHLLAGRINPETIEPEWLTERPETDLTAILNQALASRKIKQTLFGLLPDMPCYSRLRAEMAKYKSIAMKGGWPIVPSGMTMKKGERGYRVAALSARLISSGDLKQRSLQAISVFDDTLEMAIRKFQFDNGLKVDGEVGPGTIDFLNKPALDFVRKIAVNMERWRWLSRDLGERYIMVNIAAFSLDVVENGKTIFNMPVVVGKDYRQTPVFSGTMTYVVLNPYWHVPPTITAEDVLPAIKKNPAYLKRKGLEVVRNWNDQIPLDPYTIDWSAYTKDNLPIRFRQPPGPANALGRIKFMFPNKYDVYIHDTPHRADFERNQRAASSGCIRVSDPIHLAEYVLKGNPKWTRQAIVAALDSVKDFTVRLPQPISVHVFYCTAWVDEQGIVHFRNDIYDRDEHVVNALRAEMILTD
jgi:murein L,D-transpeptidase YcbB/YkuD